MLSGSKEPSHVKWESTLCPSACKDLSRTELVEEDMHRKNMAREPAEPTLQRAHNARRVKAQHDPSTTKLTLQKTSSTDGKMRIRRHESCLNKRFAIEILLPGPFHACCYLCGRSPVHKTRDFKQRFPLIPMSIILAVQQFWEALSVKVIAESFACLTTPA